MTDEKIKLIIGSLLHDIGKVVYREGDDRRNHSISGYDFLKENGGFFHLSDRAGTASYLEKVIRWTHFDWEKTEWKKK